MAVAWNENGVPFLLSLLFLLPILLTVCEGRASLSLEKEELERRDYTDEQSEKRSDLENDKRDYSDGQSDKRSDDLTEISKRSPLIYDLKLFTEKATRFSTSKWYVSTATAPTIFHRVFYDDFAVQKNRKYFNMAKALAPAIVRVGGIDAGWLVFKDKYNRTVTDENIKAYEAVFKKKYFAESAFGWSHFNVTEDEWELVHRWFLDVGWQVNFNLNYLNMRPDTFNIDFSNVKRLLKFVASKGLPIYGFQLFNEPNSYGYKFDDMYVRPPEKMVKDWIALEKLQNSTGFEFFKDTVRVGPDCTSLSRFNSSYKFLNEFFNVSGIDHQDVLGLHHYYFNGPTATVADFVNPKHLDTFGATVELGRAMLDKYGYTDIPLHMSETSNGFSGGSKNYSGSYGATMLYMDQLGSGALYGADVINRYTFFSHHYSITGPYNKPRPDYWVAVMHKKLIEGPVLVANTTQTQNRVRLYASCVREDFEIAKARRVDKGGVVLSWANLNDEQVTLRLQTEYHDKKLLIWELTGDQSKTTEGAFQSKDIFLNGEKLKFNHDVLPAFKPRELDNQKDIMLPKYSTGFVLIPWAEAADCVNRKSRMRTNKQVLGREPPAWPVKRYSPTNFDLLVDENW